MFKEQINRIQRELDELKLKIENQTYEKYRLPIIDGSYFVAEQVISSVMPKFEIYHVSMAGRKTFCSTMSIRINNREDGLEYITMKRMEEFKIAYVLGLKSEWKSNTESRFGIE